MEVFECSPIFLPPVSISLGWASSSSHPASKRLSKTRKEVWPSIISNYSFHLEGFPGGLAGKESAYTVGDLGSIPGLGRASGGNSCPLQYSGLENSMDYSSRGQRVTGSKSQTWLSDFHFHFPGTHEILCVPFKGEVSISLEIEPQFHGAPAVRPWWPLKSNVLGTNLPSARCPRVGSLMWGSELSHLWQHLRNIIILQFLSCPSMEYEIWLYHVIPPIFCCVPSLCLQLFEELFWEVPVCFTDGCSAGHCGLGVLRRAGEIRIFLLCHLGHSPQFSLFDGLFINIYSWVPYSFILSDLSSILGPLDLLLLSFYAEYWEVSIPRVS